MKFANLIGAGNQSLYLCAITVSFLGSQQLATSMDNSRDFKIVAFGTSLTSHGGWPEETGRRLSACIHRAVKVVTVAKAGATSLWGLDNVRAVVAEAPDVVLLEFYGNDAAIDERITVARSREVFSQIIGSLRKQLPNARIIAMAMNPMSGPRAWIRPLLQTYISAHKQVALNYDIDYVDFLDDWLALSASESRLAIPDGIHPVPSKAAEIMFPRLVTLIARGPCSKS